MRHPIDFIGTYPTNWAGYTFKAKLGYTTGVHTGVDYNHGTDDLGDPIYAPISGVVVGRIASGKVSGFGNAIIIETAVPPGIIGTKMFMRFLHMNAVSVAVGQKVSEGQIIGTVGSTGTTAAHLHFDVWTDRNGLGVHWDYHKDTALASYEDGYKVVENNKNWSIVGDIMDTDNKVKAQYYTLRGSEGTATERKGWVGRSYEEFNATARPEVASREANRRNLEASIKLLTTERDSARTQVATLTKQVLELSDQIKTQQAQIASKDAEMAGVVEGHKQLLDQHNAQIAELNKVIETKDNEIVRLSKELELCQNASGDCADKTGIELIILGIKKLFERSK